MASCDFHWHEDEIARLRARNAKLEEALNLARTFSCSDPECGSEFCEALRALDAEEVDCD